MDTFEDNEDNYRYIDNLKLKAKKKKKKIKQTAYCKVQV